MEQISHIARLFSSHLYQTAGNNSVDVPFRGYCGRLIPQILKLLVDPGTGRCVPKTDLNANRHLVLSLSPSTRKTHGFDAVDQSFSLAIKLSRGSINTLSQASVLVI